jgi:hypothetical protein
LQPFVTKLKKQSIKRHRAIRASGIYCGTNQIIGLHVQQQVDATYKPNNYNGWGMCKNFNAIEVSYFRQADAELFSITKTTHTRTSGMKTLAQQLTKESK